jgi:hypothetical protein
MAKSSIDCMEARRIIEGWTQSWLLIGEGNSVTYSKGGQNNIWVGVEKNFLPLSMTRKAVWDRPRSLQANQEKGHTTGRGIFH